MIKIAITGGIGSGKSHVAKLLNIPVYNADDEAKRLMQTDEGILISVPLTNQELANYSASARESLNRMLADLKKNGVIAMRGHLILIKDIEFLKAEIHCENCGKDICNIE